MRLFVTLAAFALLLLVGTAANADNFSLFEPNPANPPYGTWWTKEAIDPSLVTIANNPVPDSDDLWVADDYLSCYDADTKLPINCTYIYTIVGVDAATDREIPFGDRLSTADTYGGHSHNQGAAPLYTQYPNEPIIAVNGGTFAYSTDGKTVNGQTGLGTAELSLNMPENAGAIWIEITMVPPHGYICVAGCFDHVTTKWHETWVTGFSGFTQLSPNYDPNGGFPYVIQRNLNPDGDPGHTNDDAIWATDFTVLEIQNIAQKYNEMTPWSGVLSINDIGLPHGGLFDIKDDWNHSSDPTKWAHLDHRFGRAFDVNQTDGSGINVPCAQLNKPAPNYWFRAAVLEEDSELTAGTADPTPVPGPATNAAQIPVSIYCETGGRIHINVHTPEPKALITPTTVVP